VPLRICGHIISDPVTRWRSYACGHRRTVRDYDLPGPGLPGQLTEAEAWRSRIIGSRLTYRQRDEIIRRAASAPWTTVPADADLADADPDDPAGLITRASELYWHFTWPRRIPGVGAAKLHKILHLKRPRLYPILDSFTMRLYAPCAASWAARLSHLDGITRHDAPCYWAAFQEDLLANREGLRRYRDQLARDRDQHVQDLARLSPVRLQDIIAWTLAQQDTK
jgi:hypothetical protein